MSVASEFDTKDPEKQKISREIFEGWCVEQRAVEVDSNLLLQVEALEKNVISANLHIQVCLIYKLQNKIRFFQHHNGYNAQMYLL